MGKTERGEQSVENLLIWPQIQRFTKPCFVNACWATHWGVKPAIILCPPVELFIWVSCCVSKIKSLQRFASLPLRKHRRVSHKANGHTRACQPSLKLILCVRSAPVSPLLPCTLLQMSKNIDFAPSDRVFIEIPPFVVLL